MPLVKSMAFLKKHKNDMLLILAVTVLAGGIWIFNILTRETGAEVIVSVAGEEICTLPLGEDAEMLIGEGAWQNRLVISGGEASISEASCPDKVCVNSGSIRFDGQTIVCLPHKVVVSVVGGDESGLDGVSG